MDKTNYEVMYILDNDLADAAKKALVEKVKAIFEKDGKITKEDIIGKKELAYEINKKKLGYYVYFTANTSSNAITEFERQCNIEKGVVRYMAVKLEDAKASPKTTAKPAAKPAAAPKAAAKPAAKPAAKTAAK